MFLIPILLFSLRGVAATWNRRGRNLPYVGIRGKNSLNSRMDWNCETGPWRCGSLLLTTASNVKQRKIFSRTNQSLDITEVTEIMVKGPGCFILYEKKNFRAKII